MKIYAEIPPATSLSPSGVDFITTTVSWDATGVPYVRYQQSSVALGDSGWLGATSLTASNITFASGITNGAGFSFAWWPDSGAAVNGTAGASVGISIDMLTKSVTYTLSSSGNVRGWLTGAGYSSVGHGSCANAMTVH